jgi:hypothetical protein
MQPIQMALTMGIAASAQDAKMRRTKNATVHAESLAAHAKLVKSAFERKLIDGPTDARPEIWKSPTSSRSA